MAMVCFKISDMHELYLMEDYYVSPSLMGDQYVCPSLMGDNYVSPSLMGDYYGVRGNTWKWVQDFLSKRTQKVVLDGVTSSCADVITGVPQGTVILL
jgi:hypothetical protein